MARHGHASAARGEASGTISIIARLIVVVTCAVAIGAVAHGLLGAQQPVEFTQETTSPPVLAALSPAPPTSPPPSGASPTLPPANLDPTTIPSPAPPHVGIVAGHWGHDTGAICPDGLKEVDINLDVATRTFHILRARGYQVDLLEEFDPQLQNYQADALVSIHADSCTAYPNATPPASGFKVASVVNSMVPDEEARLVECLVERYSDRTGMYFHASSITDDMSKYHMFYEINGMTPGAIIETGFMYADRDMLTRRADLVAQGIVEGILCFIENETP